MARKAVGGESKLKNASGGVAAEDAFPCAGIGLRPVPDEGTSKNRGAEAEQGDAVGDEVGVSREEREEGKEGKEERTR